MMCTAYHLSGPGDNSEQSVRRNNLYINTNDADGMANVQRFRNARVEQRGLRFLAARLMNSARTQFLERCQTGYANAHVNVEHASFWSTLTRPDVVVCFANLMIE
jgi:hypothetical protein